jgi:hypothetical protein
LNYSAYYNFNTINIGFLYNLSYLNWIVISLILGFIFISWRSLFNNYISLDNFFKVFLFSIFFFVFFKFFL